MYLVDYVQLSGTTWRERHLSRQEVHIGLEIFSFPIFLFGVCCNLSPPLEDGGQFQ